MAAASSSSGAPISSSTSSSPLSTAPSSSGFIVLADGTRLVVGTDGQLRVAASSTPAPSTPVSTCDTEWSTPFQWQDLKDDQKKKILEQDPSLTPADLADAGTGVLYKYMNAGEYTNTGTKIGLPTAEAASFFLFPSEAEAHFMQMNSARSRSSPWFDPASTLATAVRIRYMIKGLDADGPPFTARSQPTFTSQNRQDIERYGQYFHRLPSEAQSTLCNTACRQIVFPESDSRFKIFCQAAMMKLLRPTAISVQIPGVERKWTWFIPLLPVSLHKNKLVSALESKGVPTEQSERVRQSSLRDATLLFIESRDGLALIDGLIKTDFDATISPSGTIESRLPTGLSHSLSSFYEERSAQAFPREAHTIGVASGSGGGRSSSGGTRWATSAEVEKQKQYEQLQRSGTYSSPFVGATTRSTEFVAPSTWQGPTTAPGSPSAPRPTGPTYYAGGDFISNPPAEGRPSIGVGLGAGVPYSSPYVRATSGYRGGSSSSGSYYSY